MRLRILISFLWLAALPAVAALPDLRASLRPICRIERGGGTNGVSADICGQAGRRWTLLMGTAPAPGEVRLVAGGELHGAPAPGSWILDWPAPEHRATTSVHPRARDGLSPHEAENILTHEVGHHLFTVDFGFQNVPWDGKRYGTLAPDWLDEGVAVWMESATFRAQRVRALSHSNPSLVTVATMEHPQRDAVSSNLLDREFRRQQRTVIPPCRICTFLPESARTQYRVQDIGVDARGHPDTVVWYSATDPVNSGTLENREFYPLAYSLLRFIRVRGGTSAVRELVARFRENPAARVEPLIGLPGLPSTQKAFDAAWHEFIRNPPPEDDGRIRP